MNMKALMAALLATAMIGSAFAQAAGPARGGAGLGAQGKGKKGPEGGRRRGGAMSFDGPVLAKLSLSATQQTKVKELKEKMAKSVKETMEKNKGDREAMRKAFAPITKQYRDGLNTILTPAQQTQYKTLMKAENEKRMKERGGRRGAPGAPPKTN